MPARNEARRRSRERCFTYGRRRAQIGERDRSAMRGPPDVERERSQTLMRRERSSIVSVMD
jgi:hypothetical protein